MEDDEERARHGAEGQQALGEVGDALLDDVVGYLFRIPFLVGLGARYAEGGCVEGRLGYEAVGEGDAQQACDARGEAEEEDVPVEAGWFSEGELGALRD